MEMRKIEWEEISGKKIKGIAMWESIGDVTVNYYTEPVYGEIEPGKPVMFGGDNFIKESGKRQAVAHLYYITGVGYIVSVLTCDALIAGKRVERWLLKPAKRYNERAANKIAEEFNKVAAGMIEDKKARDGLTDPGRIEYTDEREEEKQLSKFLKHKSFS